MSSGCTLKCRACGRSTCSLTMSRPAWRAMPTAIPAECAARPGYGMNKRGGEMKPVLLFAAFAFSTQVIAGPEKIRFPNDYLRGVLYQTVDRADIKQYRELSTQAEVVDAVRKGKPIPSGAVITLVQWSVEQDANGVPLKGSDGRFIKKDVIAHTIMEKREGWGADYPSDWPRNGEWEYAAFTPD